MVSSQRARKRILTAEEIEKLLQQSDLSDIFSGSDDDWPIFKETNMNESNVDLSSDSDDSAGSSITVAAVKKKQADRQFWKTKRMPPKGPCLEDDILENVAEPPSPLNSFFEYLKRQSMCYQHEIKQ